MKTTEQDAIQAMRDVAEFCMEHHITPDEFVRWFRTEWPAIKSVYV